MAAVQKLSRIARRGFSLLEVVVAVGIFAVGMLAVVGLFTPVAQSVTGAADAEIAARAVDALRTKLQGMPFADVAALLKNKNGTRHELTDADARSDYNPATDPQILFASRDGSKIGRYSDDVWIDRTTGQNSNAEKYFEIALIRNEVLSPRTLPTEPPADPAAASPTPTDADATAFLLAYTARLRWPAFVKDGTSGAIQVGNNPTAPVRFDHSMKQVLFFPGAVTR